MGIKQLIESGFFSALFGFGSGTASIIAWLCVLFGAGLQFILLKKSKRPETRASFALVLAILLIVFELISRFMKGSFSDDIMQKFSFLYGYVVCAILGAGICALIWWLKNRGKTAGK